MMAGNFDRRKQTGAQRTLNVVYCDDNTEVKGFVFAHLHKICNLALAVETGEIKHHALLPTKPDIVMIYDHGSLEFIQEALEVCKQHNIPVIVTTGETSRSDLAEAGFVLGRNLLTRSYHFNDLFRMIRDLVTTPGWRT